MKNTHEFKLNDFYQACVLKTVGFSLLRLERNNGKYVIFVFDDSNRKAEETLTKYWERRIEVTARDFVENISELKTRIYSKI